MSGNIARKIAILIVIFAILIPFEFNQNLFILAKDRHPERLLNLAAASGLEQTWPLAGQNPRFHAYSTENFVPPLLPAWQKEYPYNPTLPGGWGPLYICAQDKLFVSVYTGELTGSLIAYDPDTGDELWSRELLSGYQYEPIGYDEKTGRLYAAAHDIIVAFNPQDGTELFRFRIPTLCGFTGFTIHDGYLYISGCDTLVKVDQDANIVWTYKKWSIGDIYHTPSIGDGFLYSTVSNGWIEAFSSETGEFKWMALTVGTAYTAPVVGDGKVFVGGQGVLLPDGSALTVLAYDAYTGQILYGLVTGDSVMYDMSYADNILYFGSLDDYVYAVDTRGPTFLWGTRTPSDIRGTTRLVGNVIYTTGPFGTMYALDKTTGAILWETDWQTADRYDAMPCGRKLITHSRWTDLGMVIQAYTEPTHQEFIPFVIQ